MSTETTPPPIERPSSPLSRPLQRQAVGVTGASTFLGANLVGMLEEDDAVRRIVCLDSKAPSTAGAKSRAYDVDLTQSASEERLTEILSAEAVDTLVHLAFLPSPTHTSAFAHELESVGTMRALNACRRANVRKFVMWSQTFLYGAHPTNPNYLSEKHPLRAPRGEAYFQDKLDAEREVQSFGRPGNGKVATILRTSPILGPNVDTFLTRYFSRKWVPTVLGFDPLWQFLHEADAVTAFRQAVLRDAPGTFNVTGDGVLPLHTAIRLIGRSPLPMPRTFTRNMASALWVAELCEAPPSFCDFLQYLCVADGALAKRALGFEPMYTSREAVIEFGNAQRLRDVRLLSERPA
ncbi:MAG TPA: NAD-dependent epimerase/dehydratase family protein [Polyangiaceae bacterium]|nr:NAD-dependent epimerase/dehydratase family protein [Polyangiaceae bacterium]